MPGDLGARLGFTRARVTHLMDLTLLAPTCRSACSTSRPSDGVEPIGERALRPVTRECRCDEQGTLFDALLTRVSPFLSLFLSGT